jgi:hypothetical protein
MKKSRDLVKEEEVSRKEKDLASKMQLLDEN